MTNLFDALEFCLREIESGGDLETALARFPEYARELRPILKTALKARSMASAEPSAEAVRRSRSRVMQHAAEMRESKIAPRRRIIPAFQRWAIAFALAAVFLMSGNGLLSASASALPGERLYPVKRGWESIRLFFIFDSEARELLEHEFENERLHEVNELLAEGRHEVIEFAGVFMQVNGVSYVSGLQVILPPEIQAPANGSAVIVSGQTNAQGFIEIISLEILPEGSDVPPGFPIEVETESEEETVSEDDSGSGSGDEAGGPSESQISGTLETITGDVIVVNGVTVVLTNARIVGTLCIGMSVEITGYYEENGRFIATEIRGIGECATPVPLSNGNTNSGGGTNTNDSGGDDNSNDDNSNDDDSNDDDSNDDNSNDDDSNNDDSNNDNGNDNNDNDDNDNDDNDNDDNDND